jgi:hypothetical protein
MIIQGDPTAGFVRPAAGSFAELPSAYRGGRRDLRPVGLDELEVFDELQRLASSRPLALWPGPLEGAAKRAGGRAAG